MCATVTANFVSTRLSLWMFHFGSWTKKLVEKKLSQDRSDSEKWTIMDYIVNSTLIIDIYFSEFRGLEYE